LIQQTTHPQKCLKKATEASEARVSETFLSGLRIKTFLKSFKDPCFTSFTSFLLGFCDAMGAGVKLKKGLLFGNWITSQFFKIGLHDLFWKWATSIWTATVHSGRYRYPWKITAPCSEPVTVRHPPLQLPIKEATGADAGVVFNGSMTTTVVFAGHLLLRGSQVLFPSRRTLNVDQDAVAHELYDFQGQTMLPVLNGRAAHPELPGH
jgi:hypothetical protein